LAFDFFGPTLVYATTRGREMSSAIEHWDEGRFANGQSGRDLRVGLHARELETQLMEVIDSTGDFFSLHRDFNAPVAKT
jgi:hypothetical protein